MSFLFGKKKEKTESPQEAIQRLRNTEEMLNKKSQFLEKKIDEEISTARKHGTKNKRGPYERCIYSLLKTSDGHERFYGQLGHH